MLVLGGEKGSIDSSGSTKEPYYYILEYAEILSRNRLYKVRFGGKKKKKKAIEGGDSDTCKRACCFQFSFL